MKKRANGDVLSDPFVVRHTKVVLDCKKREKEILKEATDKLVRNAVRMGKSLIAVKNFLDTKRETRETWLQWLKKNFDYSEDTAQNYMRVARLASEKPKRFGFLVKLHITCLYRIASLPDEILDRLTPDTLLTDPKTGEQKPLKDMAGRPLDRALDALQGRYGVRTAKSMSQRLRAIEEETGEISTQSEKIPTEWEDYRKGMAQKLGFASPDGQINAKTKEEFAGQFNRKIEELTVLAAEIKKYTGKLKPESKERNASSIENLRVALLKWPAWAKPRKNLKRKK